MRPIQEVNLVKLVSPLIVIVILIVEWRGCPTQCSQNVHCVKSAKKSWHWSDNHPGAPSPPQWTKKGVDVEIAFYAY